MGERKILEREFFARRVHRVAKELIGKTLARRTNSGVLRSVITEVEAYDGERDLACHAARGKTPRTEVLYGEPGTIYVYLCYGIHFMLNVVTDRAEYPAAVLIRGTQSASGPGRLTRFLSIDSSLNGTTALPRSGLWFEEGEASHSKARILRTPRIGVAYAGEWAEKPWRYVLVPDR